MPMIASGPRTVAGAWQEITTPAAEPTNPLRLNRL